MLWKVHYFWKKMIFSWNISSWCMPQLEIFLIIWQVFYPYVQDMKHSVSLIVLRYLRLPYALYGTFVWKKMIFHEIFQVGPCPNLKDSSLYERFSIHMYKAWSIRYLQHLLRYLRLPNALQGTSFWKTMIFHDIFQVGACPNLKDSSLYDRFSIHIYKAWSVRYLQLFSAICDSLMLCMIHFLEKYDFGINLSSWCMPQL